MKFKSLAISSFDLSINTSKLQLDIFTELSILNSRAGLSERGALARFGCHGEHGVEPTTEVWGWSPQ